MRLHRRPFVFAVVALCLAASIALAIPARADEGGVSFWLPGQYSSMAAVPAAPGWSIPTQLYYYNGSANGSEQFERGRALNLGVSGDATLIIVTPTWAPNEKWFGGQPSFSLTFGTGWCSTSADLSISTENLGTQTIDRSDSKAGGMDLYPQAQIAWNKGNHNWMSYLMADIPVGAYSSQRLSNIGLGHTAVDVGGAYTYLNGKSGFETSFTLGVTYNGMNTATNYQSGVDSHLDWDVSQFLSAHWQIGVVGYQYYQLTGDRGSGNHVGSFESRVTSLGAEAGYSFTAGGLPWYVNLRAYDEFWAKNRLEGYAVYATLSIPLGGGPKQKH